MRLCSVTSILKYYPLPEALSVIADAGYEGVELWGGLPHAFTDDFYADGALDRTLVASCRSIVAKSGLTPVCFLPEQCIYPVNFLVDAAPPFDAAKLRERSLRYFERAIDLTAELGFHRMLVTTPFWGWTQEGGAWRHGDKALPRVIDAFGRLVRRAELRGVTLVLEPLSFLETTAVETLDDVLSVVNGVASDALVVMLDTGHVNVTAHALGLDPKAYWAEHVEKLGLRLQHLHLDDNLGDLDSHLVPGDGNFDFKSAFANLKRSGYAGWLSAEIGIFGANPIPPAPKDILRRTHDTVSRLWAEA